jgi:uncharacterized protein YkuJ
MIILKTVSQEDAKKLIVKRDDYIEELTVFNIKKITKNKIDNKDGFMDFLPSACIQWNEESKKKISSIEATINYQFDELDFNFSMEIHLVRTNGEDSFNLPYTRDNIIFLPEKENKKEKLAHLNVHLITHEIFHIISRRYPQIREVLYPLMGFKKLSNRFDMEKNLPRYVVNPDAVHYEYAINVLYNLTEYKAIPVIYFKKKKMKWEHLLLLDENEQVHSIVNRNETNFLNNKYNTHYLSHPEEICAENFRKWILQDEDIDNELLRTNYGIALKELFN